MCKYATWAAPLPLHASALARLYPTSIWPDECPYIQTWRAGMRVWLDAFAGMYEDAVEAVDCSLTHLKDVIKDRFKFALCPSKKGQRRLQVAL